MSERNRTDVFGPYWNGRAEVWGDPFALHEDLVHALDGDPNRVLAEAEADRLPPREHFATEEEYQEVVARVALAEPMAYRAKKLLVAAVRQVFGMAPFDPQTGEGATAKQCRKVLEDFVRYEQDCKKKAGA
jgi:hypothetical protein